jgi:hypothetical protein
MDHHSKIESRDKASFLAIRTTSSEIWLTNNLKVKKLVLTRLAIVLLKSFERISRETFRKDYTLRSFSEGGSLYNRSGLLENAISMQKMLSFQHALNKPAYFFRFCVRKATS